MIEKNIIFIGAPGVGKGTVAEIISKNTNLKHISTGNVFRNEIANKTELGIKVQEYVYSGGYVPDDITNKIVGNFIQNLIKQNQYFMLDGFPRTVDQALFLDTIENFNFDVICLDVKQEIILERLSGRRLCPKCNQGYHIKFKKPTLDNICNNDGEMLITREDDKPEKIKSRLEIYYEKTKPLIDFYQKNNKLIMIDSSNSPEIVADKVLSVLNKNGKI
ncbi:adenylate kinase family protein [Mycoplasma leonicaptivi]|uniref:adenylate kinase family protein n=1 Tax=Mycoplasma leonicaptivi TaxID=36742 RepID=UPI00048A35E7|nr:nucleoside monophosphate kinase [Mycoplasma leonicaptivi]